MHEVQDLSTNAQKLIMLRNLNRAIEDLATLAGGDHLMAPAFASSLPKPVRLRPAMSRPTKPRLEVPRDPRDTMPIDSATRRFVWQRDGGTCRNCSSRTDLHFDHFIPRSWGGSNDAANVQLLCRSRNLRKGAKLDDPRPR